MVNSLGDITQIVHQSWGEHQKITKKWRFFAFFSGTAQPSDSNLCLFERSHQDNSVYVLFDYVCWVELSLLPKKYQYFGLFFKNTLKIDGMRSIFLRNHFVGIILHFFPIAYIIGIQNSSLWRICHFWYNSYISIFM